MTLQQLEYVVAVDTYRNFVAAAEHCFVTQPTLSMQIKKLEEELDVVIFDRGKQPVILTAEGEIVVSHARKILDRSNQLREALNIRKGIVAGQLRLGVIPTIAPYLLPRFLRDFQVSYPSVDLVIEEHTTGSLIQLLKNDMLDAGLAATPLNEQSIIEKPLYYEQFVAYIHPDSKLAKKKQVDEDDIPVNDLILLEEGHCMRNQALHICNLDKETRDTKTFHYKAGSIETLKNLVDSGLGISLLPELAVMQMHEDHIEQVRYFKKPAPVREISMIYKRSFFKKLLLEKLTDCIVRNIPSKMLEDKKKKIISLS